MDVSSSSSRASSLEPEAILDTRSKKSKEKSKAKASTNGKEEGTDPSWPYQPPEGMSLLEDLGSSAEGFDWETLKEDKDLELWLIRVPEGVKPKYLDNLTLKIPSSSSKTTRAGTLPRKYTTFDVWNVGDNNDHTEGAVAGGDEIKNISCLLPRKTKKGQMRLAPRSISRHLVVSAQHAKPSKIEAETSPDASTSTSDPAITRQNPPRFTYPEEMLKHRYVAFGSTADARCGPSKDKNEGKDGEVDGDAMDVDVEGAEAKRPPNSAVSASPSKKKEKGKEKGSSKSKTKRKGLEDAEVPKAKKPKKSQK
ncbi:hypothetical protein VKT23_018059 [Stygiomarasmius scandens]|uniref:Uncharacterized protein n=1 Tax=Marasmiellus scandens TaxID=2682957 RepID=A0ABR1IUH0_9AGAR